MLNRSMAFASSALTAWRHEPPPRPQQSPTPITALPTTINQQQATNNQLRLGYLVPQFPGQTHAFFWREIQELERRGVDVRLISTRCPNDDSRARHEWADSAARDTRYLAPLSITQLLLSIIEILKSGPWRIAKASGVAWRLQGATRTERLKSIAMLIPAARLRRVLRKERIEHLHVHSAADAALIAMFCRLIGGPNYSLTLHGDIRTYGPGQREKWSHAAFGITVNQQLRQQVIDRAPDVSDRLSVAPMGVDVEKFDRRTPYEPPKPGETWRLVSCGRLHLGKGHADLIEAVALLRETGQPTVLTILGEGSDRDRLTALINSLQIGENIRLLGSVGEERVRDELEVTHLFILASHNEALGVATMEAMAMRVPVVVTDVGGVKELVRNKSEGFLVPPHRPDELASAIVEILNNPMVAKAFGDDGRQRVALYFHAGRSADQLAQHAFGNRAQPGNPVNSSETEKKCATS